MKTQIRVHISTVIWYLRKSKKIYTRVKATFSTNSAGKAESSHAEELTIDQVYHLEKIKLLLDRGLQFETQNTKAAKKKKKGCTILYHRKGLDENYPICPVFKANNWQTRTSQK